MFKKGAALFTILSFVVCSSACVYWPTRAVRNEGDYPAPGRKVARVVKADGQVVDFVGPGHGRILTGRVEGQALASTEVTVELKKPLRTVRKRADGTVAEIVDAAGGVHYVLAVERESPDSLVVRERRTEVRMISIPLSEVRLIKYRKMNAIMTAMTFVAVVTAGLFVSWAIAMGDDM